MKPEFKFLHPNDFTQEIKDQIIDLGKRSGVWQESDIEYYKKQFPNPRNINIVYQNEEGLITGFILARPHNEAVLDYLVEDPKMTKSDTGMFYIDHVGVDESVSGKFLGLHLIIEMIKEANKRGVFRFSAHCRVINGLSKVIQRKFRAGVDVVRRIEEYTDCNNEPCDYLEIEVVL
ncbi:MAG: GNAT family N-acetyltransferase [Parcubacteria group bacterium]|jgi:ribosomal protein S18 acetylase RimI-like enzyme